MAYHTDDTDPSCKIARKPSGFLDLLHENTTKLSETITEGGYDILPNFPRTTTACSSHLEPPCDEEKRWSAVGDAAIAFDPLSSQGMVTALRMGCFLGTYIGRKLNPSASGQFKELPAEYSSIRRAFDHVRNDYEGKKEYYYGGVKRFNSDFWAKRRPAS